MRLQKYLKKLSNYKILFFELFVFTFLFVFYLNRDNFYAMVMGTSMEPTLHNHQLINVSKDTTRIADGQIIVFKQENETLIKRVTLIGVQPYIVSLLDPVVYADASFYKKQNLAKITKKLHARNLKIEYMKSDEVFVEGDNASSSVDSRNFGPIKKSQIIGVYNH